VDAMLRMLCVDDHEIVREGLRSLFEEVFEATEVGEASTADEAMRLVRERDWDVVVLDISLEGRSGLDVLGEIRQLRPRLPVLVLSMFSQEQYAMRAFKAGASGYVTKGSSRQETIDAIRKVLAGGRYVSPSLAERLVGSARGDAGAPPHEALSAREYEVMRLIASGRSVTEIAEELSLSDKTISTYRARILEKMGMRTNADLIRYAIKSGLVE
jgi:two-component system invasion response regulator UvrY